MVYVWTDVAATGACSPSSSACELLYGVASEAIRGSESSAAGVVGWKEVVVVVIGSSWWFVEGRRFSRSGGREEVLV